MTERDREVTCERRAWGGHHLAHLEGEDEGVHWIGVRVGALRVGRG